MTVKNRRISKPLHVLQLLTEQINELRQMEAKTTKEKIDLARAIIYAASVQATVMKEIREQELSIAAQRELDELRETLDEFLKAREQDE